MAEKQNNPQDHFHGSYENAIATSILWLIFGTIAVIILSVAIGSSCDDRIVDLEQEIRGMRCQNVPDEAACLRALLEDKR